MSAPGKRHRHEDRELWMPLRPAFRPILKRSGFVRHVLAGLPGLVAMGGVVVLAGSVATSDQGQLRERYFHDAVRQFHTGRYDAARLGFEWIVERDGPGGDPEVRFDLAVCLTALGEDARAAVLIEPLAPNDQPGYAPAHVWKACRLWGNRARTPADVAAGEQHLLMAHRLAAGSIEVNAVLGQFYLAGGKLDRAIPYLEKAAHDRPELLLSLARACQGRNDRAGARRWAREARRVFQAKAEASVDDLESRLRWADAEQILEEFTAAVTVLQREIVLKRDARFPRALAQVFLAWSDTQGRTAPADLAGRLALLERGLEQDPANVDLLVRFSTVIRGGGAGADRARSALQTVLARGAATGPVRFALGLDAWKQGRAAEARLHWEEACRLSPQMPAVVNNLAWILATGPDPDLARALETINPVIERWPADLRFRDTRGQILARMQRWKEALPDLELALRVYPDSPELHRALAETYEHLDAPGMAAEHLKRAAAPGPNVTRQRQPERTPPSEPRAASGS
jgi:tetratricopeptide (TPR) repeat protein